MNNRFRVYDTQGQFNGYFDTVWAAEFKAKEWAQRFQICIYIYDRATGELKWFGA